MPFFNFSIAPNILFIPRHLLYGADESRDTCTMQADGSPRHRNAPQLKYYRAFCFRRQPLPENGRNVYFHQTAAGLYRRFVSGINPSISRAVRVRDLLSGIGKALQLPSMRERGRSEKYNTNRKQACSS